MELGLDFATAALHADIRGPNKLATAISLSNVERPAASAFVLAAYTHPEKHGRGAAGVGWMVNIVSERVGRTWRLIKE